jgi:hypothetical protein
MTSQPAADARRTNSRPTNPFAPVTARRMVIGQASHGAREACKVFCPVGRFASVILAYLGVATFALVSLVIGVRLLLLWRETRKLPELLIGLSFLLEGVLTNVLNLLEKFSSRLPAALQGPIHVGVVVSACAAAVCLAIGAWRIFRPREAWARNLVIVCAVALSAYSVDSSIPRDGVWGPSNLAWWWVGVGFRAGAHAWIGLEAFLYQRTMQRRVRLGLADPVIADRMWLWSLAGAASTLIWLGAGVARTVAGTAGLQHPLTLEFIAAMGMVASVTNWLVFMPPESYLRRVERRATQAA